MIFIFLLSVYISSIFSAENQSVDNNPLCKIYFFTTQEKTTKNCINVPKNVFGELQPDLANYEDQTFKINKSHNKNDKQYLHLLFNLNNISRDPDTLIFFEQDIKENSEEQKKWDVRINSKQGYHGKEPLPKDYTEQWQSYEEIQRRYAPIKCCYESFLLKRLKKILTADQKSVMIYFPTMQTMHDILQDGQLNPNLRDELVLTWLNDHCKTVMKMPNAIQHNITAGFLEIMRSMYSKNNIESRIEKFHTVMQKQYDDAVEKSIKEYQTSSKICKGLFCFSIIGLIITVYMPGGIDANIVRLINAHVLPVLGIASFFWYIKDDSLAQEFSEIKNKKAS